jgi:hypothetical protein
MWFQAVVDRRADIAAVNSIASGWQHSTHEGDTQPDLAFRVRVGAGELHHVADRCGLGFNPPARNGGSQSWARLGTGPS